METDAERKAAEERARRDALAEWRYLGDVAIACAIGIVLVGGPLFCIMVKS